MKKGSMGGILDTILNKLYTFLSTVNKSPHIHTFSNKPFATLKYISELMFSPIKFDPDRKAENFC